MSHICFSLFRDAIHSTDLYMRLPQDLWTSTNWSYTKGMVVHVEVCSIHVEVCSIHVEVCSIHVEVCSIHVEVCSIHFLCHSLLFSTRLWPL